MAKLQTLRPRVAALQQSLAAPVVTADRRMSGRKLQSRRMTVWQSDPHCACCGGVVAYPHGFELDHVVPLYQGGADVEANCQILCVRTEIVDGRAVKAGCHAEKTAADAQR